MSPENTEKIKYEVAEPGWSVCGGEIGMVLGTAVAGGGLRIVNTCVKHLFEIFYVLFFKG